MKEAILIGVGWGAGLITGFLLFRCKPKPKAARIDIVVGKPEQK